MKRFRISTLLTLTGAVAAGALLFWTSQNVQQAEDRLTHLQQGVQSEEQAIRVLHAEWDYLNRPDRLELLATEYLGLSSAAAYNVSGGVSALPELMIPAVPPRKPFFEAQPVMLQSAPPSAAATASPSVVPAEKPQDSQSFQNLLKELNQGEGAP